MKTLLTILALLLVSGTSQAGSEDPPKESLTIEGKFLERKVVKYEVFVVYADSSVERVTSYSGINHFSADLLLGNSYVIKFTARDGEVKYLYVDALGGGDFFIDVDFTTNDSARLILRSRSFSLQKLTTEEAKSLEYVAKEG